MKIIFKLTTRSRQANAFRALDSIYNNLANTEDFYVQVTMDLDDLEMNNQEVIDKLNTYKNLVYYFGESKSKVDAINKNLEKLPNDWSVIVNISDDQIITQWGFDDLIRTDMQKWFPDTDGFLHYMDGTQNRLATMSILGKVFFDRFGYIYHPSYITEMADVEAQEIAKRLGKYKYLGDNVKIMMHIHPYHGHKEAMDDLYEKRLNKVDIEKDRDTYFERLAKNFDL